MSAIAHFILSFLAGRMLVDAAHLRRHGRLSQAAYYIHSQREIDRVLKMLLVLHQPHA